MVMTDCIHLGVCMYNRARSYVDRDDLYKTCNAACDFYVSGMHGVQFPDWHKLRLIKIIQDIAVGQQEALCKAVQEAQAEGNAAEGAGSEDTETAADESEPAKSEENFSECLFDPYSVSF